jgi:PAS domain S-box-containing protein
VIYQKYSPPFISKLLQEENVLSRSGTKDEVKLKICDGALVSVAILAIPAVIASLLRAHNIGMQPVMFVHIFFSITIWTTYFVRKRLPYWFRAFLLILTFYIIAVTGLLQFGLLAAASVWFVIIPALSTILFNIRVGITMTLVIILSFIIIATLAILGVLSFDLNPDLFLTSLLAWVNYGTTYLLSGVVLLVAVSISANNLMEVLHKTASIATELTQLIEMGNAPIFGIDTKGFINEWNKTSEKITGYAKADVLGKKLLQNYITKDYQKSLKKVLKNALVGKETANFEFPILTKKGANVMILLNASTRRNSNGKITGVLGVGQDITELVSYRKKLEGKLNQRTLKLNKTLKKQKELNELKSRFVATASHEFRTPLSAINFAAGSIKKFWAKMEPIMIENKLDKIENQVLHMTQLLDDILIIGQADASEMRNHPLNLNLGNFIEEMIDEVYHSSKKSHEILLIDLEELKIGDIFIDEKLGRNIFINLLSNAIKFSPKAKKVIVELSSKKEYFIISIIDSGIGIPKSELDSIFMPFTRGENVDLIQGTGLGLSIVKEAIDTIGGEIIVNSTIGEGTTFIVKIAKI